MITKLYSLWEVVYNGFLGDFIDYLGTPIVELVSSAVDTLNPGWLLDILLDLITSLTGTVFGTMTLGSFLLGSGLFLVVVVQIVKWFLSLLGL